MEEDSVSTVKMEDSEEGRGNLSYGVPSMSGEPVVITYTTETTEDAALQVQGKGLAMSKADQTEDCLYTDTPNQEAGTVESDSFTEALAGEQLLQMANAIVMEQGQEDGLEGNRQGILQTVDEAGVIVNEMQIVQNSNQVEV